MEIDLKLLQYAVTLSRHRHFGRAAAALHISQPTLSRNIAALEKQLGVRVFERSRRDVTATPAGGDVLRMADELVARAEVMSSRLQLVRDGRGGRLRVAAASFPHDIAVHPASIDLVKSSPTILLELMDREWLAALDLLMTDRVDFAVMDILQIRNMPALRIEPIAKLAASYVCRAGHPLLRRSTQRPADLKGFPFVMTAVPASRAMVFGELDSGATIDATSGNIMPSIAVVNCRDMLEIVAATDAITVAHISQVRAGVEAGRLAVLDLPWKEPFSVPVGFVYKRERTLPPAARTFMGLIRKRLKAVE